MKQRIRIHKAEANTGCLDFSHLLDAPAGKHGFVTVRDGHFYFEDGERARFIGFNVATRSNTPDHETADKLAARFASMGVNVIRLHAADAPIGEEPGSWSSAAESPLLDYESGSTRTFTPEGLDRFDYFAAKLKERGIYLHIDLLVARGFLPSDDLDYPGGFASCTKCFPMFNPRLIELQKEYAHALLSHVNPYTNLALKDDPAVITVQINNEESAIKGTAELADVEWAKPYRDEVRHAFNHFLLMKYGDREHLAKAWTFEGLCALKDDEDPEAGTVRIVEGSFYQPVNDPLGAWDSDCGPARYADYMEFGIDANRRFYRMMKNYLRSLGVKVPIVTSNLLGGAADVYGHTDGDLMENNSYFNHPLLPWHGTTFTVPGPTEYVSVNPLTVQRGVGSLATTIPSLASLAAVRGKPLILSEWNEYGLHPFHSTSFVQTVAYACLNDWDGLILYNHHTSEHWDDQPADEILNVFDAYNDPALISQWGFMATVFLKGLVSPSSKAVDVVHTQDDLLTLPNWHAMPNTILPYLTGMRSVFLDGSETYQGNADIALNAGYVNSANLAEARHGVYYAWSPYRDAMRRSMDENRLVRAAAGTEETEAGVHLGERALVIDDIARLAGTGDYREFARVLDAALKRWGVLAPDAGLVDGKLVSETKEIVFDPDASRFSVRTPYCAYFSGAPAGGGVASTASGSALAGDEAGTALAGDSTHNAEVALAGAASAASSTSLGAGDSTHNACAALGADGTIELSDKMSVHVKNERISLALLPVGTAPNTAAPAASPAPTLAESQEFLLTAVGTTGMDATEYTPGPQMMGIQLTNVTLKGKLYAETLEGTLYVKTPAATLEILSPTGAVLATMQGEPCTGSHAASGVQFTLDGSVPGVQYRLRLH